MRGRYLEVRCDSERNGERENACACVQRQKWEIRELAFILLSGETRETNTCNRVYVPPRGFRCVFRGDAPSVFSLFTGEGIYRALTPSRENDILARKPASRRDREKRRGNVAKPSFCSFRFPRVHLESVQETGCGAFYIGYNSIAGLFGNVAVERKSQFVRRRRARGID